jgi:Transglutaminase-like superfamily
MKYSPKKFNIEYKANFNSSAEDNEIRIWIAQPLSFGCQKIENFSIFPKSKNCYKDRQGNKILYFQFKNIKDIEIKMNIKVTLWKDKVNFKKNDTLLINNKLLNRYIKSEEFLKQTSEIKKLTSKIIKNNDSILDKIISIFNFIVQNFEYCYPVKERGAEELNSNSLKGDCGEYSSLFVTMCRILKIPARNSTGFVISPAHKKIMEHGWVSLYLKPCGWLDFDTQYASIEKNKIKKYFGQRNDYRIIFTNGFNIPLKPAVPKDFKLDFWNNIGIPLKNNSAQTLQPIIFVSKNNLNFKDEIKIKKS